MNDTYYIVIFVIFVIHAAEMHAAAAEKSRCRSLLTDRAGKPSRR